MNYIAYIRHFRKADLCIHIFRLLEGCGEKDYLDGEEEIAACEQWELPNIMLSGLWESIIVEETMKQHILGYASSSMIFTAANINSDIIGWNRMILLHGPPGTGKATH